MSKPSIERAQTSPFLLRTFVKLNGFHRMELFEDNVLPVADEQQVYTWPDATLRELVTSLRSLEANPLTTTLRHPHARFTFRVIFPDPKGRISSKEIGSVFARDIAPTSSLDKSSEPSSADAAGEKDEEMEVVDDRAVERERRLQEERTLEELQVKPGDWLDVAIILPVAKGDPNARNGAGSSSFGASTTANAWGAGANGAGGPAVPPVPRGAHWRGGGPAGAGAGSRFGGRGAAMDEMDEPSGRRRGDFGYGSRGGRGGGPNVAPLNRRGAPRRGSPDRTLGGSGPRRGGRSISRSRSRSPSRSPARSMSRSASPPRRRNRYRSDSRSPIRD